MLVHGFQLLDIWLYHSTGNSTNCQRLKFFDAVAAGIYEIFAMVCES